MTISGRDLMIAQRGKCVWFIAWCLLCALIRQPALMAPTLPDGGWRRWGECRRSVFYDWIETDWERLRDVIIESLFCLTGLIAVLRPQTESRRAQRDRLPSCLTWADEWKKTAFFLSHHPCGDVLFVFECHFSAGCYFIMHSAHKGEHTTMKGLKEDWFNKECAFQLFMIYSFICTAAFAVSAWFS